LGGRAGGKHRQQAGRGQHSNQGGHAYKDSVRAGF
jgi:hypothetical protein